MGQFRNTRFVVESAWPSYARAIEADLMQVTMGARAGKRVRLPDGREVVEFINCSYLGLDQRPDVIAAGSRTLEQWGVHFCCARSRLSIGPLGELESGLSELFGGRAVTFPSVSSAHMSVLPLLAGCGLFEEAGRARFIFDRFAHASMQVLRPILADEATVVAIPHNDLPALRREARAARQAGEVPIFVGDGVYSMGGAAPVAELLALAAESDCYLYLDDAHGTSIYGARGEGYVPSQLQGAWPSRLVMTFSLAKGFGTNGGGVVVPDARAEQRLRSFGQTYAFSGPLDFAVVGAALRSLELHRDGTVRRLQEELRERVRWFDRATGREELPFNPIRVFEIGDAGATIDAARRLLEAGYFVSAAFFPVVPQDHAQLRICVTVGHAREEIEGLAARLRELT